MLVVGLVPVASVDQFYRCDLLQRCAAWDQLSLEDQSKSICLVVTKILVSLQK